MHDVVVLQKGKPNLSARYDTILPKYHATDKHERILTMRYILVTYQPIQSCTLILSVKQESDNALS